jgi:tetratricopeptide (TPR) repeat protein
MNQTTPLLDDVPWSPSLALRVERICNRFEAACKAGQRPRIEHYLETEADPERLVLLRELLAVEVEYRRNSGEGVTPEEYCRRFSDYADQIGDLLVRTTVPRGDAGVLAVAACPQRAAPGDREMPAVPGYEVLEEVGRGGMGVVYRARQVRLKRLVALKMILAGPQAAEQHLARFRAEAEAIARLAHPNIVQIYEIGDYNHVPYLALEYVDGGSLDRHLAGTPQEPRSAAVLLEALARAVHFAHQKGIVHRDLKPANVLLSVRQAGKPDSSPGKDVRLESLTYEPKITDFGLAKRLDGEQGATQSGVILGTPSYMAPEQASGKARDVGPAADTYALGAILYEVLTGRPPFKGPTPLDTLEQVLTQDPVAPRRLQPALPRDLETICLKCLAKEPRHRYASACALADDLRCFLAGQPIQARPIPALARGTRWVRRRPALAWLVLLLALAPFATLGALLWHDRDLAGKLEEALTRAERSQRQADGEALLRKAQAARAAGDLPGAKLHLEAALEKVGAEGSPVELRAEALRQLGEVQRLLDWQAGRAQARARHDEFWKDRNTALFYESQFTGLTPAANAQATRTAARQALELFAARGDTRPERAGWDLDLGPEDWFSAAEREKITSGCYELLLILARATAQPLEGEDAARQAGATLRLLDRAARLRRPTRAWHLCRAACLNRQNDRAAAARETALAEAVEPADAVDHFLLGNECAHRKNLPEAIAHFKIALRLEPDSFWSPYYLAVCALQMQQPEQAESSLTLCQSRRPDFVWVYVLRGWASGQLGERAQRQPEQARLHFADADADFRQAETLLERRPDPEAAYVLRVNRAATWMLQGKDARARKDLRDAIAQKPKQFNAYLLLAEACVKEKNHAAALAQLDTAIRLEPKLAAPYHQRGQVHLARGDLPAALGDFTKAVELLKGGPRSATDLQVLADAHARRGRILYYQQRYDEALQAFDAARAVRPGWSRLHLWRGGVLQDQGRYQEARQAYDDYLRHEREPEAAVYEARGLVCTKLRDHPAAVADYSRALDLAPSAALYCYRGWTYLVRGSPGLALQDFDRAVDLPGRKGDAHVGRGSALVQLDRTRQGIDAVREGLRLGPVDPGLLYNAAQAYAQAAGKEKAAGARRAHQDQAVELLDKALRLVSAEKRADFWRDHVENADGKDALAPIRQSPGFARLAAAYSPRKR